MGTPPETNSPRERADEIIDAALALPAEQRGAFLDQACGEDASLRRLVEGFLKAHKKLGSLKERPPTMAVEVPGQEASEEPSISGADEEDLEMPHELIGRYKLLQKLGEGGCGVVYMAEQQEPVKRMVALKVIKLGMDTRQVIARFEAERQALALMDHPNIA